MIEMLKDMNRELNRLDQKINNLVEKEKTERAMLKAIAMIVRYGNHKEEQIKALTEDYCDEVAVDEMTLLAVEWDEIKAAPTVIDKEVD